MLCRMLTATGTAGTPESYFHRPDQSSWARGLNLADTAPMADILTAVAATAIGGRTGIRLQQHSFTFLLQTLAEYGPTDPDRITNAFGPVEFIWLRRVDKVAQAVSLLRAQQTGLWHGHPDGTDIERLSPVKPDGYDADAIGAEISTLIAADTFWQRWFDQHQITPLALTYEALMDAPQQTLSQALAHIGADPKVAQSTDVQTRKLADATSADWIARYRADPLAPPAQNR